MRAGPPPPSNLFDLLDCFVDLKLVWRGKRNQQRLSAADAFIEKDEFYFQENLKVQAEKMHCRLSENSCKMKVPIAFDLD